MSSVAWSRRRRALGRGWGEYRRDREGIIGLVVLAVFVAAALGASPRLVDPADLRAVTAT